MRPTGALLLAASFVLAGAGSASAQLIAAAEGPVAYGHHHLNVTDRAAHERFWGDTLGGIPTPFRDVNIFKFPNVLIFLTDREPSGGTVGSTVNHIGFSVSSVQSTLEKVRAAGYAVVTRQELDPSIAVEDGIAYIADQDTNVAVVMAPDNVKVELIENRSQAGPIAMHHVHFFTSQLDAMKAWYVKTFDAKPGTRGAFEAADLPGVNLTFSAASEAPAGTRGRSVDHVGFEVDKLEAFCQKLEAQGVTFDRPYTKIEALNIALAYLTDPFGTYIELTEGLDAY